MNAREVVLPLLLDDGTEIFCDSIAGGARSVAGMPCELTLTRRDPDGSEMRVRYAIDPTTFRLTSGDSAR